MSKYIPLGLIALFSAHSMSAQLEKPVKTLPVPVQTVPVQTVPVKTAPPVVTVNPRVLTDLTARDVDFQNWGFEKGLVGWTAEGTAFATQPTVGYNIATQRVLYTMEYNNGGLGGDYWKNMGINPGYTDNYWIGTYENNPRGNQFMNVQGDAPVGKLTSQEFKLTTNYCYFNIGGGADPGRLYVDLQMIGILPPQILTYVEEDAWKAMAASEAGLNRTQITGGRELTKENRVKNFLEGLQISAIDNPAIKTADYFEKAAMFCVKNNRNLNTLPGFNSWFEFDRNFIIGVYNTASQVYKSWNARYGNNQPLRRLRTGNREWDYNTDGMAHYGMMPDFFQDLKNIGLRGDQLSFLFQSAEDYIRMWEKTVKASGVR